MSHDRAHGYKAKRQIQCLTEKGKKSTEKTENSSTAVAPRVAESKPKTMLKFPIVNSIVISILNLTWKLADFSLEMLVK